MEISIIIVYYKTPIKIKRCLSSIFNSELKEKYEIIIIDNHSCDNINSIVNEYKDDRIKLIQLNTNIGFGRANNIGIQRSSGQNILLINSDVYVKKNTISSCIERLKRNKTIGALGCKILNPDGTLQKSIYYYEPYFWGVLKNNLVVDYFTSRSYSEIVAVMGAFLMIPKKVFDKAGTFDPDFFMYSEEIELCSRIRGLEYIIDYYDEVSVVHEHGGSSDKKWATQQNYLSNALLVYKQKGVFYYFIYHFLLIVNFFTNLSLLWHFNKDYRTNFWFINKSYFSNILRYLLIPIQYAREIGKGKKILKLKQ